jgi:hypothetical protein
MFQISHLAGAVALAVGWSGQGDSRPRGPLTAPPPSIPSRSAFAGFRYPPEVVVVAVAGICEAVRRLGVDARVLEVTRQPGSIVHLRAVLDPVARYLDDAMALASTDELPGPVAARVVPAFCRFALESAFTEVARRRLLARGVRHFDVEQQILAARKLAQKAALALFDDAGRGGDVHDQLRRRFGPRSATAYQQARRGAHDGADLRHLRNLVDDTRRLALAVQRR